MWRGTLPAGRVGRKWVAIIVTWDIAPRIIGVNPLRAKLTAFCGQLASFIGISVALFFSVYWARSKVGEVFGIQNHSLCSLVIIGGLGRSLASFCAGPRSLVHLACGPENRGRRLAGLPRRISWRTCSCVVVGG